jgi:hypothetical protein
MSDVFHIKHRQIGALYRLCALIVFVFPASTNYKLQGYGFGSGGEENATSTNYALDAMTGETGAKNLVGANYSLGAGLSYAQQADVPAAPTFDNPSDYYDKLRLILNTGGNASDALFAVAISSDNWSTTQYVQSDMTVGSVLGSEDYRTYASWGSGTGSSVLGLVSNTTYKVKAKAIHGKFTETGYGPEASAATSTAKLSFDIDVSATDTETTPPFTVSFGNLIAGTVTDSPVKVWVDFATNGNSGGKVFVSGKNGGLSSVSAGSLITAATGDLASLSSGYGAQGYSATQGAGGPFGILTPYDLSGSNVGVLDSSSREIFSSAYPITSGRASFLLKAKSSSVTPAAGDYTDTLTVVTAANF